MSTPPTPEEVSAPSDLFTKGKKLHSGYQKIKKDKTFGSIIKQGESWVSRHIKKAATSYLLPKYDPSKGEFKRKKISYQAANVLPYLGAAAGALAAAESGDPKLILGAAELGYEAGKITKREAGSIADARVKKLNEARRKHIDDKIHKTMGAGSQVLDQLFKKTPSPGAVKTEIQKPSANMDIPAPSTKPPTPATGTIFASAPTKPAIITRPIHDVKPTAVPPTVSQASDYYVPQFASYGYIGQTPVYHNYGHSRKTRISSHHRKKSRRRN